MLAKSCALTIWLLASVLANSAEIDCSRRLDDTAVSDCCAKPRIHFEAFRQSCGKFLADRRKNMSPCMYDCIFNASQVISGTQLNVENAQRMIAQLLGNNREFVDAYLEALQKCAANETQMLKYKKRLFYGSEHCTLQPLYLGMCSAEYVFVHCPPASWTRSETCEQAREYKLNCRNK